MKRTKDEIKKFQNTLKTDSQDSLLKIVMLTHCWRKDFMSKSTSFFHFDHQNFKFGFQRNCQMEFG